MKTWIAVWFAMALGMSVAAHAQEAESPDPYAAETPAQRDARMAWWREARFGMFIHWGVYAVPAGFYHGRPVPSAGEWIMITGKIPVADYRAFAEQFNPVRYDPVAWARLAKDAGMRYIVITSKHHDGFALFPSKASTWNVADATPYGRDLIGPLCEAARREGLHFGLYYSQAQDWTNPGGAKAGHKEGESWDEASKGNFDDYLAKVAVPQVREILTRYPLDILWWDTSYWMTRERAEPLISLLRLRPGIIHNNRLGGGFRGDTDTPEQHIPATGIPGRDWEVCMTMNGTWGFKSNDLNWKSTEDLIRKLCDIASKGGNFLLNVGPTAEGEIPPASVERLRQIGAWMKVNGEAIYGTTASPFRALPWGRCTKKARENDATLYLHIFDWPSDGRLTLPGLRNDVVAARLLAGGAVTAEKTDEGVILRVPEKAPDPIASVIAVEIAGPIDVQFLAPPQDASGVVSLTAPDAELNGAGETEATLRVETKGDGAPNLGCWTDAREWARWTFNVRQPGAFRVALDYACEKPSAFEWAVDDAGKKQTVDATGGYEAFRKTDLGEVQIAKPGMHTLTVRPVATAWNPINIRSVTLQPAP